MLLFLLVRWAILGVAFAITAWLLNGMDISGGFWSYVWVALIYGLVAAFIGTLLMALTLAVAVRVPLPLLTFVAFVLINALLLSITDAITDDLTIDDFWWTTIWAAIILAIVIVVLELILLALAPDRTTSATDPVPD